MTAARLKNPRNLISQPFIPPVEYLGPDSPDVGAGADRKKQHDDKAPEVEKRGLFSLPSSLTGIVNSPQRD